MWIQGSGKGLGFLCGMLVCGFSACVIWMWSVSTCLKGEALTLGPSLPRAVTVFLWTKNIPALPLVGFPQDMFQVDEFILA